MGMGSRRCVRLQMWCRCSSCVYYTIDSIACQAPWKKNPKKKPRFRGVSFRTLAGRSSPNTRSHRSVGLPPTEGGDRLGAIQDPRRSVAEMHEYMHSWNCRGGSTPSNTLDHIPCDSPILSRCRGAYPNYEPRI